MCSNYCDLIEINTVQSVSFYCIKFKSRNIMRYTRYTCFLPQGGYANKVYRTNLINVHIEPCVRVLFLWLVSSKLFPANQIYQAYQLSINVISRQNIDRNVYLT